MNLHRTIASVALSAGMLLTVAAAAPTTASAFQYAPEAGGLRGLIDRTQSDVRAASDFAASSGRPSDRFRDTQRALSDFDRHLAKGHFHHGDVDRCIEHLKGLLDKTTLQAGTRDALMHDVEELRIARDRRGD